MSDTLSCLVCGAELKNLMEDGVQPCGGLALSTSGHYGSAVFDPMDGTVLEVVVCDECLKAKGADGIIRVSYCIQSPKRVSEVWKPDDHESIWETTIWCGDA